MIGRDFDGHPARDFLLMTPDERMDKLSREVALVLELRASVPVLLASEPSGEHPRTPIARYTTPPSTGPF